jgi:uncharacterized protein YukE
MAAKLGEMQAHLIRLDALGERVQGLAASSRRSLISSERRGVAEKSSRAPSSELNMEEFQAALDALEKDVEHRSDYMNAVETQADGFQDTVKNAADDTACECRV